MNTKPIYIVAGIRTPFTKMGTALASLSAVDLGQIATSQLLARTGLDPDIIDHVVFGCVGQPVDAANMARVVALRAGIPERVPAYTVHRNCASGFEAITQAAQMMAAEQAEVALVGGAESMSQIPLLFSHRAAQKFGKLMRAKSPLQKLSALASFRPADFKPRIGLQLGLTDPSCGLNMGETAENIARHYGISRAEQDAFSVQSHLKAVDARERLAAEICPVYLSNGHAVEHDNGPREGQTIEAQQKLKTVFDRKAGTVTPGNASQITDGAVALLMMTEDACQQHGYEPLGRLVGYSYVGCNPAEMGLGPVFAIDAAEKRYHLGPQDADLIEINEAFAAQVLGVMKASKSDEFAQQHLNRTSALGDIPIEKLNVNGGAIALGHPVGSSGARLALTALHELKRRNAKRALVSLCVGGGQGGALWLERD